MADAVIAGEVVPARAGVFPRITREAGRSTCRPRPRGGVPIVTRSVGKDRVSSPPARGCSRGHEAGGQDGPVVPARAGVFPGHDGMGPLREGRPRPRGGVPMNVPSPMTLSASSPPARGCSVTRIDRDTIREVVPARAGVFRAASFLGSPRRSSSPPARGCSNYRLSRTGRQYVVPARAGVFPSARATRVSVCGRPRPRGGVPRRT